MFGRRQRKRGRAGSPTRAGALVLAGVLGGLCFQATAAPGTRPAVGRAALDLDEDRLAAKEQLLERLAELAEWCTKKKIYARRVEVYEAILHFDSESSLARRGLGFIKNSDGKWVEKERRVEAKDWDKSAARKFPERRAEVAESYREAMFALLDKYEGELSPVQREAVLDDVLFADPDDPRVHAMRGETRLDDKWVLLETARAKEHRAELRTMVRKAFQGVPKPEPADPNDREQAFGIGWKAVYATPVVRSLGTGSDEEVQKMTKAMAATRAYFNAALGVEAHFPQDFTVFSLARPSDKMAFLMGHPVVDDQYRDFLFKLDGSGIQGSGDLAHWSEEPHRRLDGMVRQAIAWLFAEGYGILPKQGWVFEGLGLYLTRELVGTRLTWYVQPSEYLLEAEDHALKARLLDTRTNWMNEALKVLRSGKRPSLSILLGRSVNQLTTEDLLVSYVLCAYLLEAQPEKLPAILRRLGEGQASATVLEEELACDLPDLYDHLTRWLGERR